MGNTEMALYVPEGQLTSALLSDPSAYEHVRWLDPDLFAWPVTRKVYVAVQFVLRDHPDVNGAELVTRVKDLLIEYKHPDAVQFLIDLVTQPTGLAVNVNVYARSIFEARQREDLKTAAVRIQQIVNSDKPVGEIRQLLDETYTEMVGTAEAEPGWRPIQGLMPVSAFMADVTESFDWVIPGLLERQERLMVIALEKAGKTVLTRQVSLMLSAGVHPFDRSTRIPAMRTLLVDLENPAPIARRDFRRQVETLSDVWAADNDRAYILHRPAGIHLGDPHDRLLLRHAMEHVQPDLLCISPIYKAYDGLEQSWEQQAHGVQKPLDMLREQFNCAIWMEHHAPGKDGQSRTREIRPFGSTRWGRWLDYQVALQPTAENPNPPFREFWWRAVRRDERKMAPMKIRRGMLSETSWVAEFEDGARGFELAMHYAHGEE